MTKEEIGRIIKESRVSAGLTQLQVANTLNRPQQTVASWEVGRSQPDANTLFELFRLLGRSVDEAFGFTIHPFEVSMHEREHIKKYRTLDKYGKKVIDTVLDLERSRGEEQQAAPLPNGMKEIKVYDQPAAAGLGNYLDEPDFHVEQYPAEVIPSTADFGVIISGDSMEPRIYNGGTAFVRACMSIDPGETGIFVLNGKSYCKKLMVDHKNRAVRLVSLNPAYDDIVVGEFDELRTVGQVVGQWTPQEPSGVISNA